MKHPNAEHTIERLVGERQAKNVRLVEVRILSVPQVLCSDLDRVAQVDGMHYRASITTNFGEPSHSAARVENPFVGQFGRRPSGFCDEGVATSR
jgi:hypothetical protein